MIINGGRRLLVYYGNHKIKLFSRGMKFLCSLCLPTKSWDIAVTGDSEAGVSDDNEAKLLILDVSDRKMSIKRTVKLTFKVVPYKDEFLVASSSTCQ